MTRKDTIIAAVLVNAGLLIVLFASALKSGGDESPYSANESPQNDQVFEPVIVKEEIAFQRDEVDQVLKQYAQAAPVQTLATSEMSPPSNFVEDLQSIATLPQPVQPSPVLEKPLQQVPPHTDYKVKKGDVLEKIARHHSCSVDEIMKLNKLSTSNLRIGQSLKLPKKNSSDVVAVAPSKEVKHTTESAKYYTVKNGDNPWTIASKNHIKLEELLKLNNLDQEKARKLKPGDRLRIQ
ncbi:MAG: LysM peptidoglycan-binding domain-containing protein [Chlamydiales bacterium]|nr:LysM peptidoglycan-binding domain-containing protein [Chlamydiales bacterium]